VMRLIEVFWILRMHPYARSFWKPIGAGAISFGSLAALSRLPLASSRPGWLILLAIAFSLVLYAMILARLGPTPEDEIMLRQIRRHFRRKVADVEPFT